MIIMIQNKSTFFLGIIIVIIPFLGFPGFWKTLFIVVAGIFVASSSIKIVLPRKASRSRNRTRREKITPVFVDSAPVYPKDDTIENAIPRSHSKEKIDIK